MVTIILICIECMTEFLDYIFHKDSKIIVFGSNTGQYASGSSKALFDYIKRKNTKYKIYYYEPFKKSLSLNSRIQYIVSFVPIFFRASFLVSTHPPSDFIPYLSWSRRKVFVNVWHGTPFKSIFFADKSETKLDLYRLSRLNNRTSAFIVSSNLEAKLIKKCFLIDSKKIYCLGHPRNDILLKIEHSKTLSNLIKNIPEYNKVILYCPTYRESNNASFFPFSDLDLEHLNRYLKENKMLILIRAHYYDQKLDNRFFSERIIYFGFDVCEDINPILPEVDILVTDYSSIYIDYLLIDRPMIFIPYDLENYKANRGILLEYESWTPGPKVLTYRELIQAIEEIISGKDKYSNWRNVLSRQFHSCQTNNSCEKVSKLIDKWKSNNTSMEIPNNTSIKILQVCHSFYPCLAAGGVVRVSLEMSRNLVKRGHLVTVYTTDGCTKRLKVPKNRLVDVEGIKTYYFSNLSNWLRESLKVATPFYWFVTADNDFKHSDVVHIHEFTTMLSILAYYYATKYKVPYVFQAHGSLPIIDKKLRRWFFDRLFGNRILKGASRVIALSEVEVKEFQEAGVPREKITIISNGIDFEEYENLPPKGVFKKRYNIEKEKNIILFLGRINQFKGIDFLINAFSYIIKSKKNDNLILVIAGPDDGYLRETKKLVNQHKIGNKVIFPGPLFGMRKIEAYVDASIVTSLDSLKEVVFLLVPLEAAASGTPIIVTKSNYIATLAEEGSFGFAVEYGNIPELVTTFEEILSNEKLQKQMGLNGRKYISENLDWKIMIDKLEDIYQDVMKKNHK